MSFMSASAPAVQPLPVAPSDDQAGKQARLDAERTAAVEAKIGGRASTIAAGMDIAATEQYGRGLLSQKRRASSDMGL